jgi:hypothetical protein
MESWLKLVKAFVVLGGIVLVFGTVALGWLLVQRATGPRDRPAAAPPAALAGDVPVPAGSRVEQVALDGSRILLLLRGPDQQQYLALVNAATGERQALLRVAPEPP